MQVGKRHLSIGEGNSRRTKQTKSTNERVLVTLERINEDHLVEQNSGESAYEETQDETNVTATTALGTGAEHKMLLKSIGRMTEAPKEGY